MKPHLPVETNAGTEGSFLPLANQGRNEKPQASGFSLLKSLGGLRSAVAKAMADTPPQTRPRYFQNTLVFRFLVALCLASGLSVRGGESLSSNSPTVLTGSNLAQAKTEPEAKDSVWPLTEPQHETPQADVSTESSDTNSPGTAPEQGLLPTPGVLDSTITNQMDQIRGFQVQLDLARRQRQERGTPLATRILIGLLETNAPDEVKRQALFELALVSQDDNQTLKAQQIFAQYLSRYPDDPSAPEVLLRQGLIYRQMGVTTLAISKFYAVMSTALKLKLNNMDYYKKLVLQAQVEIADTYYLEGKYLEASDFFGRLLKNGAVGLNKAQIQYKLIRSLSCLTNNTETIAKAQVFLDLYPDTSDVPEVRFLLASALKQTGRNQDSMKQVLLLLQSQAENVRKNPDTWIYWQQRAGNEIANQLYKEGDYLNALEIYVNLADLNKSPAWQLPVWYQTALVYEQLQQWQKATDMYTRILDRRKELTDADTTPSLLSLFDMAKWRKDYIAWMEKSRAANLTFHHAAIGEQQAVAAK
jgi:tetratricopeptide (TPR) repeat protein